MDGAVYNGDPTDRKLMRARVVTCGHAIASLGHAGVRPKQGPEKLFLMGTMLDRAATLSFMGLDDARTAKVEVKRAHSYFRIASGLTSESSDYRAAAIANEARTRVQLQTLAREKIVAQR
jgi:hypothetical protein